MTRRIVVHRWPAVPAAANVIARTARSRSADGVTTAALLPPSSRSVRPIRAATRGATCAPIRSDPVALTSWTRGSSSSGPAASGRAITSGASPGGAPTSRAARSSSAVQPIAVRGVSSEGFQTTASPQTRATAEFQAQTATGKLNAEMTATTPSGCQVSISRCPGRSEGMVRPLERAGEADREVADVDHLLHLADRLRADLADLDADQVGEVVEVLGEQPAEGLDELPAHRRRHRPPGEEGRVGPVDRRRRRRPPTAPGTSNSTSPVIGVRALTGAGPGSAGSSTPSRSSASCALRRSSSVDETVMPGASVVMPEP